MKKSFTLAIVAIITVCTMLALATTSFADEITTAVDNKTEPPTVTTTAAPATTATTTATTVATTSTTKATTARVTEVAATTKEGQTFFVDGTTLAPKPTGNQASVNEPIVQTGSASGIAVFAILGIAAAAFIVTKSKKEN